MISTNSASLVDLESRVVGPLLGDGAHRPALVVVGGVDARLVGEDEELVEDRVVLGMGVAVLEVGAPGAADEEGVAGEHPVGHHEGVGVVGVARGVEGADLEAVDLQDLAVGDLAAHAVGAGLGAHEGHAAGPVAQGPEAGDVVSVDVGVDGLHQLEVELLDEAQVAVDLLVHRVDEEGLAAGPPGQEVGVGAGRLVEELPEDHGRLRPPAAGRLGSCRRDSSPRARPTVGCNSLSLLA